MQAAYGYIRTSSAANVGGDKDSEPRQLRAIESFAKANGYRIAGWFRDPAVSGSDPVTERPGFNAMLTALTRDGVNTILVESPDRFARDLIVLITGHDYLRAAGIELVPTSAPNFFVGEETPTARLVRQVLGAFAEFEKSTLVNKLRGARDRKRELTGRKVGGRKNHAELNPETVAFAKQLRRRRVRHGGYGKLRPMTLAAISAELANHGHRNENGQPYSPTAVRSMILRK